MKEQRKDCSHWRLVKMLGEYQCSECGTPFSAYPKRRGTKRSRKTKA